jgi:hypothetical protein
MYMMASSMGLGLVGRQLSRFGRVEPVDNQLAYVRVCQELVAGASLVVSAPPEDLGVERESHFAFWALTNSR